MNPPQKLETLEQAIRQLKFQCLFLFISDQNYLQAWLIPLGINTLHDDRHLLIVSGQLIYDAITFHD